MSRKNNIKIFEDTLKHCKDNEKLVNSIDESIKNQKIITEKIKSSSKRYDYKGKVIVSLKRTLEAASNYKNNKVAVLNFASYTNPGGGVLKGSGAQEEAICRCSTLYLPLCSVDKVFYEKHKKQISNNEINVLHGDECIYTPNIIVFKEDIHSPKLLDEDDWYSVDVISAAAPNLRKDPSNIMNPDSETESVSIGDEELLKIHIGRITQIFEIAKNERIEVLILGAFGCGAFKNPPEVVANAFRKVVDAFIYDFKIIEFAIPVPPKGSKNYDVFNEIFKRRPKFNKQIHEQLVDLFKQKKSLKEAAEITQIPLSSIEYWIEEGNNGNEKYVDFFNDYKNNIYIPCCDTNNLAIVELLKNILGEK